MGKPRAQRKNPGMLEAEEQFESFHGAPGSEVIEFDHYIKDSTCAASLGELTEMEIEPLSTGRAVVVSDFDGALLTMNPEGTQLYIDGGDTEVDIREFGIDPDFAHEKETLGLCRSITYFTTKHHLGSQGGEAEFTHEFGEDGGEPPVVIYDTRYGVLSFAGGSYQIAPEGITN